MVELSMVTPVRDPPLMVAPDEERMFAVVVPKMVVVIPDLPILTAFAVVVAMVTGAAPEVSSTRAPVPPERTESAAVPVKDAMFWRAPALVSRAVPPVERSPVWTLNTPCGETVTRFAPVEVVISKRFAVCPARPTTLTVGVAMLGDWTKSSAEVVGVVPMVTVRVVVVK